MNWLIRLHEHYRSNNELVDIFGVILYTDAHAHVKKVLADHDYWNSLDEISGPHWAIFSIKPQQGQYGFPNFPRDTIGFLVPVWKEPAANKPILEVFGIKSTEKLPLFVVFTQSNDEILKIELNIEDDTIEKAYNSLKKHIEVVTEAVHRIDSQYKKNAEGVFNAIKMNIDAHKNWETFKKGIKLIHWLKGFMP